MARDKDRAPLVRSVGAQKSQSHLMGDEAVFDAALRNGDADAVRRALIHNAALATRRSSSGEAPLIAALRGGFPEVAVALVQGCASLDVNATSSGPHRSSALQLALASGHSHLIGLLLGRGASPEYRNAAGNSCFLLAVVMASADFVALLFTLVGAGVLEQCNNEGLDAVALAAEKGRDAALQFLIDKGARLDRPARGLTPLHLATLNDQTACMRLLLAHGQSATQWSASGMTPFHYAAANGHARALQLLAEHSAPGIDSRSQQGWVPLHHAVVAGSVEAVELLLRLKCDPSAQVPDTRATALHLAVEHYAPSLLKVLLARVNLKLLSLDAVDAQGRTAAQLAHAEGNTEALELLLKRGASGAFLPPEELKRGRSRTSGLSFSRSSRDSRSGSFNERQRSGSHTSGSATPLLGSSMSSVPGLDSPSNNLRKSRFRMSASLSSPPPDAPMTPPSAPRHERPPPPPPSVAVVAPGGEEEEEDNESSSSSLEVPETGEIVAVAPNAASEEDLSALVERTDPRDVLNVLRDRFVALQRAGSLQEALLTRERIRHVWSDRYRITRDEAALQAGRGRGRGRGHSSRVLPATQKVFVEERLDQSLKEVALMDSGMLEVEPQFDDDDDAAFVLPSALEVDVESSLSLTMSLSVSSKGHMVSTQ